MTTQPTLITVENTIPVDHDQLLAELGRDQALDMLAIGFYIATSMAPLFTAAAVASGFSLPEGAVQITSIADGFLWPPFLFVRTVQGLGALGLVVLLVVLAAAFFFFLRNTKAWEVAAGAPAEAPASAD